MATVSMARPGLRVPIRRVAFDVDASYVLQTTPLGYVAATAAGAAATVAARTRPIVRMRAEVVRMPTILRRRTAAHIGTMPSLCHPATSDFAGTTSGGRSARIAA